MPWKETGPVLERTRFIEEYLSGFYSIAELGDRYGVSRKTLYKWLARHDRGGLAALCDRSRSPMRCPHQTEEAIAEAIVNFRRRFPFMGPRKIIARLRELEPHVSWPAPSTAGDILRREGLVTRRRRRHPPVHPQRNPRRPEGPNDLMTIDFKGQFRLKNGRYCYPLTIVDAFSRYIFACEALDSNQYQPVRKVFEDVFRTYGLPRAILSDNGSPFASPGIARLSRLSLWWIQMGIGIERIVPGHPEQNGSHERMHRTLKEQATRPPSSDLTNQQRRFDRFRHHYNEERPHESLGQRRPTTLYVPSPRPYPETLPLLKYPRHFETRRVSHNGQIRWRDERLFLSHTLEGHTVGLEEIDDGVWSLYYGPVLLARFDERERKFFG